MVKVFESMNIFRMDYFIADFLDAHLLSGHTQEECDRLGESYAKQIHKCINSPLWDDRWMDEDFGVKKMGNDKEGF